MEVGDKVIFQFHAFGVVSEAETTITKVTEDYIEIGEEGNDGEEYRFDKKNGKCLNDNNILGGRRTVKFI